MPIPIYEYLCTVCGTEFELVRPLSAAGKPARCPKCNSEAQKLISGFACKTGASMQVSPKPFREAITESVGKQAIKGVSKEKEMGTKGRKNVRKPKKQQERKK